jgi:hypothetical protein
VTGAALVVLLAEGGAAAGGRACAPAEAGRDDGVGVVDPFVPPTAQAYALNRRGRELYQEQRFEEARASYRAALAADPAFVAPLLNVACSYAREGRFAEAVRQALPLAERAFVPWAREILEASDLAPLHAAPEMKQLRAGLAAAAAAWGQPLGNAMLLVARTRPPVHLRGEGVLHLGLNQEIFAWFPETGRFRQVTAEDGRVLAFVRSRDGRTVVFVRAGKLVRAGGRGLLRDLSLRTLELPSMTLGPPVVIAGDVDRLELAFSGPRTVRLLLGRPGGKGEGATFDGETLAFQATPAPGRSASSIVVVLDAAGVTPRAAAMAFQTPCRFTAREVASTASVPQIRVQARTGSFVLPGPWGAGLFGLSFPP